jgi:hypothetical protein
MDENEDDPSFDFEVLHCDAVNSLLEVMDGCQNCLNHLARFSHGIIDEKSRF